MFGDCFSGEVEMAVATVTSCPAAERIPHHLPSPQRSFSISVNTWQTLPPHRANALQACNSFCWGYYCAYFFPFSGSPLLQNLLFPWCDSWEQSSITRVPEIQSLASFPSLPSPRSMSDRAQHATVLALGRKQRSEIWSCKSATSGHFWF